MSAKKTKIYGMLNTSRLSILLLIIALASLFPSRPANANAYVVPVRIEPGVYPRAVIDIISWSEASGVTNPCYGSTQCWVGPDVQYESGPPSLSGSCLNHDNCIRINQYQTAEQVAAAFRSAKGIPYRASFIIDNPDVTCIGLFYVNHKPTPGVTNAIQWPGSVCGKIPPTNQTCSISLPAFVNHGALSNTSLNGKTNSVSGNITCTQATNINLVARSTTGERYVYLNSTSNFYSNPLINNKSGWSGANMNISGNNAPNPFTFTSELHASGTVTPGYYTGNAVVIIAFD
ncbi:MrpH family fimbial adhesin [Providencia sp. Je.9.19]|uniref:MrpH family fimbial adhesin n=1 Tax=Providencia sp. Je.9.19 TaxID=3142844 RepID=UPI003DA866EA